MNKGNLKFKDIDRYHHLFPVDIQIILGQLKQAIIQAAPLSTETIRYNMPVFRQNKVLVYYEVHKAHIGFYPTAKPIVHFKKELEKFKTSKGAIQFPIKQPLPLAIIKSIVKFTLEEDSKKTKTNDS